MTHTPAATGSAARPANPFLHFLKRYWLALLIAILAVAFVVQNLALLNTVEVTLYFWTLTLPLWLVTAIIFFAGGVAGWIFARRHESRKATRPPHQR